MFDIETIKLILQAGCFGLVAFAWIWMFAKQMPALVEQQKVSQDQFLSALQRLEERHQDEHKNLFEYWDGKLERMEDRGVMVRDRNSRG